MRILESPRLLLRHFEPDDLGPLAALYGDPDIRRHYPDGVRTIEETRAELEWFRSGRVAEKIGMRYERELSREHGHALMYSRLASTAYAPP